jgi:hypothetical protein
MAKQKRNTNWVQEYFFLFIPPPLPDELLSSWLTRVAHEHARRLPNFLTLFVKREGSRITSTDLDFQYNEQLFQVLAQKSGLNEKTIYKMSLRNEEGYLFTCNNCLYPPKQIRKLTDKRTHFGLMYCPQCLQEDKIPYFRKQWRYYFYNACPKHNIYLTDRCWKCYKPIKLSKLEIKQDLSFCAHCGYDLKNTITIPLQQKEQYGLNAIDWFKRGLKSGYFIINNQKINSLIIFQSFTKLSTLLDKKEDLSLESFPLIYQYKNVCKDLLKYASKKVLPIKKDFLLTSMVYYIFQNYPNNLISLTNNNGLTHRDFVHGFKDIPFWYKSEIDTHIPMLNTIGREITQLEVVETIKYLKRLNINITQEEVAKVLGCHYTINKSFKKIYKKNVDIVLLKC